jgi:hypothetical protein
MILPLKIWINAKWSLKNAYEFFKAGWFEII